jgi:protoporphyrinogen oxidase
MTDTDPDDVDTETKRVQTYIPAYQKEIWQEHADTLGMSTAEFVRSMVQAGRRGYLTGPDVAGGHAPGEGDAGEPDLPEIIRERTLAVLRVVDHVRREELQEVLTEDVEEALDAVLDDLQEENAVLRRRDGFELVDDPEGDDVE